MQLRIAQHWVDAMVLPPHHLEIDGREQGGADVVSYELHRGPVRESFWRLTATDAITARLLTQVKLSTIPDDVGEIRIPVDFQWRDFRAMALVKHEDRPAKVLLQFRPHLLAWSGPYAFATVVDTIRGIAADRGEADFQEITTDDDGTFTFHMTEQGMTIGACIDPAVKRLEFYRDELEKRLQVESNGLTISFNFPQEVRVACEQYLLYFGDFLANIGVSVQTGIREDAGRVLFSVTPEDSQHALSTIREALSVYLALPGAPLMESSVAEPETLRLLANIHHLKGQMQLAKAQLQAQTATIDAQRLVLDLQQTFARANVVTPAPIGDREELLGGTVTLTRYQGKGFEISLAEVFRRLRALFGR
jgi:hypothetical protein